MTRLNPYLMFNGNCAEAMEFYKSCLGGDLTIQKIGDSPMGDQMPDKKENVMHSMLKAGDMVLMASDMMGPEENVQSTTISLCINNGTFEELKIFFSKLSEGGKVTSELKEEFFGIYGDLVDKYGVRWMFEADKPKAD